MSLQQGSSRLRAQVLAVPPPTACSAAMTLFYLWNLLLFKPNLPSPKQH
jgi:hypothetical protein